MFGLGRGEMILSGIIVVLIFGWTVMPRLGQRIGSLFDK
jgi:Sec-independent protein translocase protein TatA